jgi:uroporphyrin-III C-methyltransferase/precorrin-2 dehydrogenase/sirohydrochlorin ferrochelatase
MRALLFPMFLKLAGRKVVLVGGGKVAASKLVGLLACEARITVVAPEVCPEVDRPGVTLMRRAFTAEDLDGAWLVVAAATADVNRDVAAAAEDRHVFVNAVDDPDRASAYAGGVLRKGSLTMAVSTGGEAPALAGLIREGLEALLPDDVEAWLPEAIALRRRQKETGVAFPDRRPQLLDALNRLYRDRPASVAAVGERRA